MIFTLEALKAAYGDALLLHYGTAAAPGLVLIDGGPRGIYTNVVKRRLDQLRQNPARLRNGSLPIRMVMVSHIDDDHINGILELAKEIDEAHGPKPYAVQSLWHNSFDDIVGNQARELAASLQPFLGTVATTGELPPGAPLTHSHAGLVVASVGQGRELRDRAHKLGWDINPEFGGKLLRLPQAGARSVAIADGLTFTVLGPTEKEVENLNTEWDKTLKAGKEKVDPAKAAAYADDSVFNLSSVIVLAEAATAAGPRRMLLTGDARGDRIIQGLQQAGQIRNGVCRVDVLKLPHHGSERNLELDFFKTVVADHYVISCNGEKFDNPDQNTLDWLVAARKGTPPFTVYLTYPPAEFKFKKRTRIQKEIQAFIDAGRKSGAYKVVCRDPAALSVRIDLGEPLKG